MRNFPVSAAWIFGSLWVHRSLIAQMTRREVTGRYRGSAMGLLWTLLHPVLMLAVYTFVFSEVFKVRWAGSDSQTEFAAMVFAGMIVHGVFAEALNRAPQLVLGNPNFVKKVVFPLEVLPWVSMGSALFHGAVYFTPHLPHHPVHEATREGAADGVHRRRVVDDIAHKGRLDQKHFLHDAKASSLQGNAASG
jgi:hypothetical protein